MNLSRGRFLDDNYVFITHEKADDVLPANVEPGDLIFTHRGTIGQVSMVPRQPRFDRYAIGSSQVKTRLDEKRALPEFYYYWFQSGEGQRSILAHTSTVGVPGISTPLTSIRNLQVPYPPLVEQQAIVAVLGALDEKIDVNERITTTADEISASIFERARLKSPDLFAEQALSDTAEFINGRAFTKGATGDGQMVVRIAEINSGPSGSTVYNKIKVPDKHLARPGDVLFAWSGSLTVARWFRPEAIINQHIFKCVPKNGYHRWLINQLVHRKINEFRAIAADKATTMGHIQRRNLDEPVQVPKPDMFQRLDAQISPLWDRALCAEQESLSLATLRDNLLPQLMSGRLHVRDAEKIVEDHA
ncbi:restriction endonuclease subunit S [Streptomyces rubiginosohelvolus]|uniref:restriction endonuclease subunit S n=1 Tax=Streptomyces rubiginosohelvolus TaxID=67362 RepID=UPI0033EBD31A